jgi:hypothetical protein
MQLVSFFPASQGVELHGMFIEEATPGVKTEI